MAPTPYVAPTFDSTSTFKPDIFKGKVLFATGGGSGIGKGMVRAVMQHGADAVILGRNVERLQQAAAELSRETGSRCIGVQTDVRYPEQVRAAVAKAIETFGRIDFVLSAAAGNFLAPIANLTEKGFRTVIEIDVLGTYHTIKATLPHLRKTKGSYIHVSATLHYKATPYQVHVSAAKAAIDATSAVLAVEEGPHGVRSNVVAPGPIGGTEGYDRLGSQDSDAARRLRDEISLGREGDVRDCGNAAVYLFSDAASWVTGQIFVVDGGHEHLRTTQLPYPTSVLDPEAVKDRVRARI